MLEAPSLRRSVWWTAVLVLALREPDADALRVPDPGRSPEYSRLSCDSSSPARDVFAPKGAYVSALLDGNAVAWARLLGPSDTVLASAELHPGIPTLLSALADESGTHHVEIECQLREPAFWLRFAIVDNGEPGPVAFDSMFREAMALAERPWEQDRRLAVRTLEDARVRFARRPDPVLASRASAALADLYFQFGEPVRAVSLYQQSMAHGFGHDPLAEIDAYIGMARANRHLDRPRLALTQSEGALERSRNQGDLRREARALDVLAEALFELDEYAAALDVHAQSRRLWQVLGDIGGEAASLTETGYAQFASGDAADAEATLSEALTLARAAPVPRTEAHALVAMGHARSLLGKEQGALRAYNDATSLIERIGNPYLSANLYSGLGFVHEELGDWETAIRHYSRSLELHQRVQSTWGEAGILVALGIAHRRMGELELALPFYERGLELAQRLGDTTIEVLGLSDIALLKARLGEPEAASAGWDQALAISRQNGYVQQEADVLLDLGTAQVDWERWREAESSLEQALALCRQLDYPLGETRARYQLARLDAHAGRLESARERLEEAIDGVERLRGNVASYRLRASFFDSMQSLQELYVDVLVKLHAIYPDERYAERAFIASEAARARSLLDILAAADDRSEEPTADHSELVSNLEGRVRVKALEREIGADAGAVRAINDELSALLESLDFLETERRDVDAPEPPLVRSLEALQGELEPGTLLLAYELGDERSVLWSVRRDDFESHLIAPQSEIEPLARDVYGLLAPVAARPDESAKQHHDRLRGREARFWQVATSLSRLLLQPLESGPRPTRVVIVGDGILNQVPFSTLPLPGSDSPVPLVTRYEVVRLPSASVLSFLRARSATRPSPEKAVAVVADPVFGTSDPRASQPAAPSSGGEPDVWGLPQALRDVMLSTDANVPRLLASRQEARRILALVPESARFEALGFDAHRELVTSGELNGYRIIHFATHGILDEKHPDLSGVVLSLVDENGNPRDGFVRLRELYGLDLPAELVVLSACSTALGKRSSAEGLVGLVRGFLSAGASSVIASYWKVDDVATAELMARFYESVFRDGLAPAAALRHAQLAMWNDARWRAPFYWAAFELQGDWS